ncbi:galactosylgalactosylxylosylprotein 3-beta-glucuronosyltransferase P-like [Teleopsis dalmanni]|uniref:galactosylgalactosylxylosylprotein 3-beta-glucuronosyltransferase P-like n=1 Tax=Teleopsis dalmanni TaxID=139649 RepID=UPI0018CCD16A|nr:galactosylgalactosylxylosylprotein 3-beta-glucuronosyltransferase P-like [Teleopsis dalmanni]
MALGKSIKMYLTIFVATTCIYMVLYQYHISRQPITSPELLKSKDSSNLVGTEITAEETGNVKLLKTTSFLNRYNLFLWSPVSLLTSQQRKISTSSLSQAPGVSVPEVSLTSQVTDTSISSLVSSTTIKLSLTSTSTSSSSSSSLSNTSISSTTSSTDEKPSILNVVTLQNLDNTNNTFANNKNSNNYNMYVNFESNKNLRAKLKLHSDTNNTKSATIATSTTKNATITSGKTIGKSAIQSAASTTRTRLTTEIRTKSTKITNSFVPEVVPPPPLYIITPTYRRPEQLAELTRLGYTLKHITNLLWLVIEDANQTSPLVQHTLNRIGVPYIYLIGALVCMLHVIDFDFDTNAQVQL